jgi:3'-phosphoadenosine 5'-phosphosulfate sulfotransferase (PAPS reductase)/FAD synthetase
MYADVINFSGGRTSAYMTKRLFDERGKDFIVTFQNTGKEMPQTLDFIHECDVRWGLNLVWLEYRPNNGFEVVSYDTASRNGQPFEHIINHKKGFLPNVMTRYCTDALKIQTARRYLKSIGITEWTNFNGIRYDEPRRWSKMKNLPSYQEIEMPLVAWKVTKKDVLDWWAQQDFDLELKEPYGNCDCCFLKGKNKLLQIARENPQLLDWWIEQESKHPNVQATFKKEISYQELLGKAKSNPTLWDNDVSFECFCNID